MDEPLFIREYRKLATGKTNALNEALAYIDNLRWHMKLIKLTSVRHPDINGGEPYPVFVNPDHIVMIERTKHQQTAWGCVEAQRQVMTQLWQECRRVVDELAQTPNIVPETEQDAQGTRTWFHRKDAANSLQTAYGMLAKMTESPAYYPAIECTCIQLSVPNARYTMLPSVYVSEGAKQVAMLVEERIPGHWSSHADVTKY